jgi:hypothetical protein
MKPFDNPWTAGHMPTVRLRYSAYGVTPTDDLLHAGLVAGRLMRGKRLYG